MRKTMCELFAGVGGFRLGLKRLKSGWKTVWFSQWEPGKKKQWAHDCYERHFGKCADLDGNTETSGQDISLMPKASVPDHTLLVGGFPCLTGDTLVFTSNGYVPIRDVKKGDMVLSHDGEMHAVTNVFDQGVKPVYRIRATGHTDIYATENHRFLVRKCYRKWNNERRTYERKLMPAEWKQVKDFVPTQDKYENYHFFGVPVNTKNIIPAWNGINVAVNQTTQKRLCSLDMSMPELWYLVGRYLGDGWLAKIYKPGKYRQKYRGIVIACGRHKTQHFEEMLNDKFSYTCAHERTADKYHFCGAELAAFMMQFGVGASGKKLPLFVYDLPVSLLEKLIEGYADADGGKVNAHRKEITSVNLGLLFGIAQCIHKVYKTPTVITPCNKAGINVIEGRICHAKNTYTMAYQKTTLPQQHGIYEDGYMWYPITKVLPAGEEHVYDIAVDQTHSFVANNCISHNCQDYSVAHTLKSSKGIEGKKGVLWWQIRDVMMAKKPAFCIFENVDRLLKSPAKQRGRDFGIILTCLSELGYSAEWRVVNAALYGAAQRRRRVFIFAYRNDTRYGAKMANESVDTVIGFGGFMQKAFPAVISGPATDIALCRDVVKVSDEFAFSFENAG